MTITTNEDLPVFIKWMEFLKWLLKLTEKFPKRIRFTFSVRIENIALDIAENLVEARYNSYKRKILKDTNLKIEKIRILLRLCHELRYISYQSFEHAMRCLNEIGKMVGAWIKNIQNETIQ